MNEALKSYLETRRTIPANMMTEPGPDHDTIQKMLALATRVPDHGKLAPWRFIVISGEARQRIGSLLSELALRNNPDMPAERREQEETRLARAPVVIVVVSKAAEHPKIPQWEQVLSAGAICLNLYMAANAFGFAANWLSEWISTDRDALDILGVTPEEQVAGMIHIGTPTVPPNERPRPDVETLTTWLED
ncbi:nitroreductase family protein [Hoeflea prorocentri]|uniref:Putative NAD(P)H nitroreductase n=1 Tax=Hoeflea prorocentri TaxID=1922333 RepID=A0A9X3UH11_9HYPH|nr:nitroreductase [Hoeflea prorocentri]MCY6380678.1 nitroreductase [Hoeflea prorocentri]MDA5398478.1 nitroreductase [Hoeflea prorocentri]